MMRKLSPVKSLFSHNVLKFGKPTSESSIRNSGLLVVKKQHNPKKNNSDPNREVLRAIHKVKSITVNKRIRFKNTDKEQN